MFRLTVVSGPLRGNVYTINDGETSIGRAPENVIVFTSNKVSKRHCHITVNGNTLEISDDGSSNGTFVNGGLIRKKIVKPGDRLGIGDFICEVSKIPVQNQTPQLMPAPPKIVPLVFPKPITSHSGNGLTLLSSVQSSQAEDEVPKDLIEKVKFYFEKYVLQFLFRLNEKYEWNLLLKVLFVVFTFVVTVVSTFPTFDKVQDVLLLEGRYRARLVAKLMADRNSQLFVEHQESRIDINFVEKEPSVRGAYIVDTQGRIVAPASKMNQTLTDGQEGRFLGRAYKWFQKNDNADGFSMPRFTEGGSVDPGYPLLDGNLMGYAEPIRAYDPQTQKNSLVGLAIVFLDLNQVILGSDSLMALFLMALVMGGIFCFIVYVCVHSLTKKPLETLEKEFDHALTSGGMTITSSYQMKEMEGVSRVAQSALQKLSSQQNMSSLPQGNFEDYKYLLQFVVQASSCAYMAFDEFHKIIAINSFAEEITSIKSSEAIGQSVDTAAHDPSFNLLVQDLFQKCSMVSSEAVHDQLEFSGVSHRLDMMAVGPLNGSPKGYLLSLRQGA